MTICLPELTKPLLSALLAGLLAGCSSMSSLNAKATEAIGDYVPQWAGGLPPDAPPRPGTPKYEEFMRERERLWHMPASERPAQQAPEQQQTTQQERGKETPPNLEPVH